MTKTKTKLSTIPEKISRRDFNKYIALHLSHGKRGPKPKISYYKIFNYILYVLHTGCQWKRMPIKRNEISWNAVYKKYLNWCKRGSFENLLIESVINLNDYGKLDLSIVHGDGSNTVAKKGVKELDIQDTNIRKAKKSLS